MSNDSESGPFTVDDFIEAGFSQKVAEIWAQASEQAQRALLSIKSNMKATSDFVKTSAVDTEEGLRLVSSSFREATKYSQEYYMVLKVQKDIQNANRAAVEAASSAYAALNQQYIKARDNAKELAVQYGIQSEQARRASFEAMQLQEKLTAIDKSVGQYSRNVGNYSGAWKEYGRAASGAAGLAGILGRALGLDQNIVMGLHEAHSVLRETVRDGGHVQGLFTEKTNESTVAMEAETVATVEQTGANEELSASNEEVGASWIASAGTAGVLMGAIALLGFAIYEGIQLFGESKKAIDDEKESIKLLSKAYEDLNKDIDSLNTTSGGNKDRVVDEINAKKTEAYSQYRKTLSDLGIEFDDADSKEKIESNEKALDAQRTFNATIEALDQDQKVKIQKIDDESNKKSLEAYDKYLREIELLKEEFIQNELKRELAKIETERRYAILEEQQSEDTKTEKREKIDQINQIYDLQAQLERDKYNKEQLQKETEWNKKLLAEFEKKFKDKIKAYEDAAKSLKNLEDKSVDVGLNSGINNAKEAVSGDKSAYENETDPKKKEVAFNRMQADKKMESEDIKDKQVYDIQRQQGDAVDKVNTEHRGDDKNDLIAAGIKSKELVLINSDANAQISDASKEAASREKAIDDETTEHKKENMKKLAVARMKEAEQTLAAFKEVLAAQNQQQLESLRTDAQMLSTEAQVQAQRAAAGKSNSLDAVLKAEADNAEQQKQLQRKQKQEQDIITYSELLAKAVTAGIGSGKPFTQVLAEAVAAVFTTKATAAGLGAGFYEGTEDTGGPGTLDSLGGKLIKIHPHERIIDAEKNAMLGGVSNEDLVNGYLLNMMLPKVAISDNGNDDEVTAKLFEAAANKIAERFERAIEKQRNKIVYTNSAGDTVIEETVNGSTHTRIKKNYKIIKTK